MNDPIQPLKNQALALLRSNRLAEAKTLYSRICQSDRRDADSWNLLGAVHGILGEFQQAETCCRQVIALRPDAVGAYNNLGNALKFQGKQREAEECYRQAIRLMPGYAEAHNNLGNLLKEQDQHQQAEACYRQAIACAPDYADAHSNLGIIQREQGRLDDALVSYRRALQLDPNHRDAQYNLGHALSEQGEFAAGAAAFERLVQIRPQDPNGWIALSTAYSHLGAFDKAVASGQRAVALGPTDAEAHFHLGTIYQNLDQRDKAREMYDHALALKPGLAKARYFLASLTNEAVPAQPPAEYVRELFDEYADRFDRHLVGQLGYQTPKLLHRAVMRILGEGSGEFDILDLGCGTGLAGVPFRGIARHLSGVDLSPRMIRKARERGIYDELLIGDLLTPLSGSDSRYDLIIATDVLNYIGDLSPVLTACQIALRPGGLLAFSIEYEDTAGSYVLRNSGRYAHPLAYLRTLAATVEFIEVGTEKVTLRQERGKPVDGSLCVFQKPQRVS